MAMQSFDNVISLASVQAAHAGARRPTVKPESVAVINDCRDIAVKRITELLAKTFDTIEKELFDLAENSADREKQTFFLDARAGAGETCGHRGLFQKAVPECFREKNFRGRRIRASPFKRFWCALSGRR